MIQKVSSFALAVAAFLLVSAAIQLLKCEDGIDE